MSFTKRKLTAGYCDFQRRTALSLSGGISNWYLSPHRWIIWRRPYLWLKEVESQAGILRKSPYHPKQLFLHNKQTIPVQIHIFYRSKERTPYCTYSAVFRWDEMLHSNHIVSWKILLVNTIHIVHHCYCGYFTPMILCLWAPEQMTEVKGKLKYLKLMNSTTIKASFTKIIPNTSTQIHSLAV